MKNNIYQDLYYGRINAIETPIKNLYKTKEFKEMDDSYNKLYECLSSEQKKLFDEYWFNESGFSGLQNELAYIKGFKTGMLLIIGLLDFDPTKN